jgi:hypothetical protein
VLSAVDHATDAINQIGANDYEAVRDAAADNRLCVPTRLLPDTYDIPHPYTPAPRAHADALLTAYDTAIQATTRITAALDDLASALNAPSSLLTAAHRASVGAERYQRGQDDQRNAPRPHPVTPVPGRTEQALRKLHIRDPALLLRAAVIDHAARDLVAEATAKAHRRNVVTGPGSRSVPRLRQAPGPPARAASQDVPPGPRAGRPVVVMLGVSPDRARSPLQRRIDNRRSAE